eukprot:5785756-Amphidinium_carterae.1
MKALFSTDQLGSIHAGYLVCCMTHHLHKHWRGFPVSSMHQQGWAWACQQQLLILCVSKHSVHILSKDFAHTSVLHSAPSFGGCSQLGQPVQQLPAATQEATLLGMDSGDQQNAKPQSYISSC